MTRRAVDSKLKRLASRFRGWLQAESSSDVISSLLYLSDDDLTEFAVVYSDCVTESAVRTVIDRSQGKLGRKPPEATGLARLATRLAHLTSSTSGDNLPDPLLLGDAWRQLASALVRSGEYFDAERTCERAEAEYARVTDPVPKYEQAALALVRGHALCYLNRAEEALKPMAVAAEMLRALKLRKKFVSARTMYANVLSQLQRYVEAAEVYKEAAVLAGEDNDTEALAHIINNIGYCYASLGDAARARTYLTSALSEFTRLGLKAHIPVTKTALVRVLVQEERYNEAISELFEIRRAFLELEMPVVAADTGLWLLDLLYFAGRLKDVPSLSMELVKVFQRANLPVEAKKAMGYLNGAVARGVMREDVQWVRGFMVRLQASSNAQFIPPSVE